MYRLASHPILPPVPLPTHPDLKVGQRFMNSGSETGSSHSILQTSLAVVAPERQPNSIATRSLQLHYTYPPKSSLTIKDHPEMNVILSSGNADIARIPHEREPLRSIQYNPRVP
ncbi:hypothetical protein CC2G_009817 [Coprinopsis cinerea AmutBmut pab1-1]|nr:hypothetical protein CC2G_009817 [Coprinopsis cinerea AmutBmut pab1-1]